jgi:hypothetical protein
MQLQKQKVYCKDCKWLKLPSYYENKIILIPIEAYCCDSPNNKTLTYVTSDWFKRDVNEYKTKPSILNKNNKCKWYESK